MQPFEFQSVLFNFHDLILLMTAMQCLFFGILLFATNTQRLKSTLFLAAFLFAHALIPLNELIMWGAAFKAQVRESWPSIYFIPAVAYYIDGALLYFCIKSLIFKDFSLKKFDLLHLLPLLIYVFVMVATFYSHSYDQRLLMISSESFVYGASYVSMEFFSKWVRVFYAVACFILISRYKNLLRDNVSNMITVHITWLRALVLGFLVVMTAETILVGSKVVNLFEHFSTNFVFFTLGLTGNYLSFILVNLLVFTAIRHFWIFEKVTGEEPAEKPIDEQFVNPEMAAEVDASIRKNKTYMDPEITLDTLAESLVITPRDLSMLINRHFGVNFYEFINRYRIEEAKHMLVSEKFKKTTITDIYLAVGFNSKSVFYTFFKKFEGVTPSKFRESEAQ
ncbi:helix-turn-helix domain-containing protein [uncultured Paraglaciecola sp.]|jgi:AraC-like DNA-binding protein|uniref:helix-turn-helix domain-containing protein n=1 Tax=uncultured Paraglaciecola sp. TaxID=1765024 RepID=UPI00261980A1|nr:helix-turn-helix domain-containing protein [uncultured Paraglaciecola sp.]